MAAAPHRGAMDEVDATGARERSHTPPVRRVRARSPPTPQPSPGRFCPREAEELSQLVLEEHGGGSLALMHERSLSGRVDIRQLESSSFAANRKRVVTWLTKAFSDFHLRDEWLVATLTLLDRLAATRAAATRSPARVAAQPVRMGPLDPEWLAVVLCVLKLSSAEAEMDTLSLKELIFRLADMPRPASVRAMWDEIVKAEFRVYRALDYNVAVPTAADLAGRIALDVVAAARKGPSLWPGLLKERLRAPSPELTTEVCRFMLLVSFLVELGLTLVEEAVYGRSLPPVALALVAVEHALRAFGDAPAGGVVAVDVAKRDTLGAEAACLLPPLSLAVYSVWVSPPAGSKVHRKWEDRADAFLHGALPTPPVQAQVEEPPVTPDRTPRRRSPPPATGPRPSPSKLGTGGPSPPALPPAHPDYIRQLQKQHHEYIRQQQLGAQWAQQQQQQHRETILDLSVEVEECAEEHVMIWHGEVSPTAATQTLSEEVCGTGALADFHGYRNRAAKAELARRQEVALALARVHTAGTSLVSSAPDDGSDGLPLVTHKRPRIQPKERSRALHAFPRARAAPVHAHSSSSSAAVSRPVKSRSGPVAKAPVATALIGAITPSLVRPALKDLALGQPARPTSLAPLSVVPEAAMLQRTRHSAPPVRSSKVSQEAKKRYTGNWDIWSDEKHKKIGEARISDRDSYIKLDSGKDVRGNYVQSALVIEGGGPGQPFLMVQSPKAVWTIHSEGEDASRVVKIFWKLSNGDKGVCWQRQPSQVYQPSHRRQKRVLDSPAGPDAENALMTSVSTCKAFEDIFLAPHAKRRKVAQSSSEEVPVENIPRHKKAASPAAKENTSPNKVEVPQATQARFEVGQEVEVLRSNGVTWSEGNIREVTPDIILVRMARAILKNGISQFEDKRLPICLWQSNIRHLQEEKQAPLRKPLEPRFRRPLEGFVGRGSKRRVPNSPTPSASSDDVIVDTIGSFRPQCIYTRNGY